MTTDSLPDPLDKLRVETGFRADEHERITEQFAPLGARLRSFDAESIDMELSVKERDGADQRVTLELWAPGTARMVATSSRPDLDAALQEVRDDLVRQVTSMVDQRSAHRRR